MIRFKIRSLVVWKGVVTPIVNRWVHPDGITYLVQTKNHNRELISDFVTMGQVISEINQYAHWCVGDKVELGGWDRYIKARWWSFKQGEVLYRVNDFLDEGRNRIILTQHELLQRVEEGTFKDT